ncbi:hypothetical protein AGOR_G00195320 [Albula goreensis]|uniref:E3 ubiquitin-protein ligase TRIM39-like n=1 Tax=Albula goreensis TaxID=1534307 RepID=A0A8T3CW73_9TELE|nr:hypothetical protein AGOR_G00195320 [Albula goreensis]
MCSDQRSGRRFLVSVPGRALRETLLVGMALSPSFLSEEQFLCSICLDVFSSPVSTPCGHSFCMGCIGGYWDGHTKAWQCPLCKETFRRRPELHINRTLREITEQFKRMAGGAAGGGAAGGGASEERAHRPGELPGDLFAEMKTRFRRPAAATDPNAPTGAPAAAPLPSPPMLALRRYTLSNSCLFRKAWSFPQPTPYQSLDISQSPTPFNNLTSVPDPPQSYTPSQGFSDSCWPAPSSSPAPYQSFNPFQSPALQDPSSSPALGDRRYTLSDIPSSSSSPAPFYTSPTPPAGPGLALAPRWSTLSDVPSSSPVPPAGPGPGLTPRRYTLSGPADCLKAPLCQRHNQQLDLYCRTDQECICAACLEAEHHAHSTIPAKREWLIKKSQLGITEVELQDMIRDRELKVEEIRASMVNIRIWAETETEGSVRAFSALVSSVERSQAELLEVIEMNRRVAERQAEGLIQELQLEIAELRRRSSALGTLAQSEDHILFLRSFPALCTPPHTKDWSSVSVTSDLEDGSILRTLSQLVERCQEELRRLPESCVRSPAENSALRCQPKVKRVQEYAGVFNSSVPHRCGVWERHQPVPDSPERFDRVVCVLGQQGFTSGRHYWEVEVGGKTDWDLGVASHSINRKGKITVSPAHGYWFLSLRDRSDYAFRTEPSTSVALSLRPRRIGIYLDYHKGQVSFYNVDARLHIYTFMDTFTDVIHPFFSPCTNKSGKNEAPSLSALLVSLTE